MSRQRDNINPPLPAAQREWMHVFADGPYTSMNMLRYILTAGKKPVHEFLQNPKKSIHGITENVIKKQRFSEMATTCMSHTGRCTSFAIKAAADLTQIEDARGHLVYDFHFYDLGRHRLARCVKTTIVLDSSSTIPGGAFPLPENQSQAFPKTDGRWKYKSSQSKFARDGNLLGPNVKKSGDRITAKDAMVVCLKEVEESASKSVPTLFRSINKKGEAQFHGIIVWCPADHAVHLGPDTEEWRAKRMLTIQWAKYPKNNKGVVTGPLIAEMVGTQATHKQCIEAMAQFIKAYGGPRGEAQWDADGINRFSVSLFKAANDLWGWPRLIDTRRRAGRH